MIAGMHCACTGKGSLIPLPSSSPTSFSDSPASPNVDTGAGAPRPRTLTPILARRAATSSGVRPARERGTVYRFFRTVRYSTEPWSTDRSSRFLFISARTSRASGAAVRAARVRSDSSMTPPSCRTLSFIRGGSFRTYSGGATTLVRPFCKGSRIRLSRVRQPRQPNLLGKLTSSLYIRPSSTPTPASFRSRPASSSSLLTCSSLLSFSLFTSIFVS